MLPSLSLRAFGSVVVIVSRSPVVATTFRDGSSALRFAGDIPTSAITRLSAPAALIIRLIEYEPRDRWQDEERVLSVLLRAFEELVILGAARRMTNEFLV